ncbi:MAG: hypothetical protein ACP5MD_16560 [Verrucomicrobiia bacterium]
MQSEYSIRRANLDDLPVLRGLWETACLPVLELEKHLTDFQVVLRPDGVLVGTMGLRVSGSHGLIYGESFSSAHQEEQARPFLWEKLLVLARNRGCERLWMKGIGTGFWQSAGFRPPGNDELLTLPKAFGDGSGRWLTLVLREGTALPEHVAAQLARLQEEQYAQTERIRFQARLFKWIAGVIALLFLAAAAWLLFKLLGSVPRSRF